VKTPLPNGRGSIWSRAREQAESSVKWPMSRGELCSPLDIGHLRKRERTKDCELSVSRILE